MSFDENLTSLSSFSLYFHSPFPCSGWRLSMAGRAGFSSVPRKFEVTNFASGPTSRHCPAAGVCPARRAKRRWILILIAFGIHWIPGSQLIRASSRTVRDPERIQFDQVGVETDLEEQSTISIASTYLIGTVEEI